MGWLDVIADGALEVGAVVATEGELLAVLHDHAILAVEPRLHLFDLVDLHDRRTMDASKLARVELLFQAADRLAQQISLLIIVDAYVISFRLDALNVVHAHEEHAPTVLDHESLEGTWPTLQLFQQREDVTIALAALIDFDLLLHTLPSSVEALAIERLEQVVEDVHLERAHGILIVGGNKDDIRSRFAVERFQHFEAAQLGHLYIQKDEVGLQGLDRVYCFTTIRALRDTLDVRIISKHLANHLTSERFIVDDQRTNPSCVRHFAS